MKKKLVLVLAVLLTSSAAISLILGTSRYIGFLRHPEVATARFYYRVSPSQVDLDGITVQVAPVRPGTGDASSLLVSAFWLFEVAVVNDGDRPVDMDFDRVTMKVDGDEVWALSTASALRLLNERTATAMTSGAGRRGYRLALDQLAERKLATGRVFPGYERRSLVMFQPHPEVPAKAALTVRGLRRAGGAKLAPMVFEVLRDEAPR